MFIKRLLWSTLLVIQSELLGLVCSRAKADLAGDGVRKYGIDSFGHYRMKIRNPDSILKARCLCRMGWPGAGAAMERAVSTHGTCMEDPSKLAMPGFGRSGLSRLTSLSVASWPSEPAVGSIALPPCRAAADF